MYFANSRFIIIFAAKYSDETLLRCFADIKNIIPKNIRIFMPDSYFILGWN